MIVYTGISLIVICCGSLLCLVELMSDSYKMYKGGRKYENDNI